MNIIELRVRHEDEAHDIFCLALLTVAISGEHVTKLVPKLSPVEECVDVPKV